LKFSKIVTAIDTHSSGEGTRIITGGIPKIPGRNMAEKQAYFQKNLDHLRKMLLEEPRGSAGLLGAVITEPTVPEADVGVIYLWTGGYFSACGDSTYSISAMLVNSGMVDVEEPTTQITLDTVAGLVRTRVKVVNEEAEDIAMLGTPSFYLKTVKTNVAGVGKIEADIAYGGLWYAFIDASKLGFVPTTENKDEWIRLGWKVRESLAEKVPVEHPTYPELNKLDIVTFHTKPTKPEAHAKHANIFGPQQTCRSPAGTATNARMAALYGTGELKLGEEFVAESIIGTLHRGRILKETMIGSFKGILPEVSATAYITGIQQFVVDPRDPLRQGFLL
jgi:proline racemase/trans-L-3-hydroxyproline dehydratase